LAAHAPARSKQMNRPSKALTISVAVHAASLAAIGVFRPHIELGTGASTQTLQISIVDLIGPLESNTSGPESTDLIEASGAPNGPDVPAPEMAVDEIAAAVPETRERPQVPEPEQELQAQQVPEPISAPTLEPVAEPVAESVAESDLETIPKPSDQPALAATGRPADVDAPIEAASEQPADREELSASAPRQVASIHEPVADVEAELISERIEKTAKRFAALGEWQAGTSWSERNHDYVAEIAYRPSGNSSGYDEAIVTVSTIRAGQTYSTQMRMQRLGFSHYAQFIDRWDPDVQIHDDQIDGRFHSNSEIFIQRRAGIQPTFLGKVTTARNINTSRSDFRVRRDQVFLGGLETRVGRIDLPPKIRLFDDEAIEPEQQIRFDRDTRVVFQADGTLEWQTIASRRRAKADASPDRSADDDPDRSADDDPDQSADAAPDAVAAAAKSPSGSFQPTHTNPFEQPPSTGRGRITLDSNDAFYILASEGADIHVSGTVNGKILVYTPEDIVVEGSLVYAEHPIDTKNGDDYLGLVAGRSIDIAEPEVTGDGDLEIHAAIFARRRFAVRNYRSRNDGTLTVIGSLTAGTLTATEPRFRTNLVFDPRLAEIRPPRFPITDRFEITQWDAQWELAEPGEADESPNFALQPPRTNP
jgi:hypothetical protein